VPRKTKSYVTSYKNTGSVPKLTKVFTDFNDNSENVCGEVDTMVNVLEVRKLNANISVHRSELEPSIRLDSILVES